LDLDQNAKELGINSPEIIKSSAFRLNSLVDDLVKFSTSTRIDEPKEIFVKEVIKEVMEDLEVITENHASIKLAPLFNNYKSYL
jgi:hypothetical protein